MQTPDCSQSHAYLFVSLLYIHVSVLCFALHPQSFGLTDIQSFGGWQIANALIALMHICLFLSSTFMRMFQIHILPANLDNSPTFLYIHAMVVIRGDRHVKF